MSQNFDQIGLIMQLRNRGFHNTRVLGAMERVPREMFVLPAFAGQAYKDMALPIDCGQTISQPYVVAVMTEMLDVAPEHRVLEIGTGSGYQTAVLAHLAKQVFTIERHDQLRQTAQKRFYKLGLLNITSFTADGRHGLPEHAPFDRIIIAAAAPEIPPALIEQLAENGVLVMPLGDTRESQQLTKITKSADGLISERNLSVRFVPLRKGIAGTKSEDI